MNNSLFSLNYKTIIEPGLVKISADYELKKAVYQPAENVKLKGYFNEVIRRFNQPVVLRKTVR